MLRTSELRGRRKGLLGARKSLDEEAWFDMLRARAHEGEQFGWLAQECLTQATEQPEAPAPDEDGVITWLFEPESFSPLARVSEKRGTMAVFTDHLGTPLCLTDADGDVAWQGVTDTYGRCEVKAGDAALCPWRFPGQYEGSETGLFYNRFRHYDPGVGAYVSRDPIGLAGGLAVHGYVDDPIAWIDPIGLTAKGGCGDLEDSIPDLDEFPPGQGFSGVVDPGSGVMQMKPSTATRGAPVPDGWVPRGGGHDYVADAFRDADIPEDRLLGFTAKLTGDDSVSTEFLSHSINGRFPGSQVPTGMRPAITENSAH